MGSNGCQQRKTVLLAAVFLKAALSLQCCRIQNADPFSLYANDTLLFPFAIKTRDARARAVDRRGDILLRQVDARLRFIAMGNTKIKKIRQSCRRVADALILCIKTKLPHYLAIISDKRITEVQTFRQHSMQCFPFKRHYPDIGDAFYRHD